MAQFPKRIFSPRWGHFDTYTFEFEQDYLKITMHPRSATCRWRERQDPVWEGSMHSILKNDSIYGPEILDRLLEYLWTSWRNNELNDEQASAELDYLIEWINAMTETKPKTPFWNHYF